MWALILLPLWLALFLIAGHNPAAEGTLISGGVSSTVAIAIFLATQAQGRRQTTLELFKEYYSLEFAEHRRAAARFMHSNAGVNWGANDPYYLRAEDPDLAGFGAVLRYWQRVATLNREHEVNRDLLTRLLSREMGWWKATILEPMADRSSMYVKELILDLAVRMAMGSHAKDYQAGVESGRAAFAAHFAEDQTSSSATVTETTFD